MTGSTLLDAAFDAAARARLSDLERVAQIRALEALKARAAAAQALLTADLEASIRARHEQLRLPASARGRGTGSEVALARRESPRRGAQHVGLALALVHEMPHTLAALRAGALSEWRATLLVRETAILTRDDRAEVDRLLCADPSRLEGWGDRRLVAEARRAAYRLEPLSVVQRARRAESERHVSLRPAPDTMSYLTVLLPVVQGVATLAALRRLADAAVATGDGRSRGQLMADTLVERVTGQVEAGAVPVTVDLTISDETLIGGGLEPAWLDGYGVVPAQVGRDLARRAAEDARATLRRLYVRLADGALTAVESTARTFPAGLARFIALRDQTCRTPWCDAPIRHTDHVVPWESVQDTSAANGQGLCVQCNHAKQAVGWGRLSPAGQVVTSQPPGLPRPRVLSPPQAVLRTCAPARGTSPPAPRRRSAERRPGGPRGRRRTA